MFKELFSLPLKIIKAPVKIVEEVVCDGDGDGVISGPLDCVDEAIEDVGEATDDVLGELFGLD